MSNIKLSGKTDADIKLKLEHAIATEHLAVVSLLAYLAEFDERKQYLSEGYSSLYSYLTQAHGYSEGGASRRITAARFARKYPQLFAIIARGDLSLSVVCLMAKAEIKPQDIDELIAKLVRKSRTAAEIILAGFCTSASTPLREVLRPVVVQKQTAARSKPADNDKDKTTEASVNNNQASTPAAEATLHFRMSVNISEAAKDALIRAQELLGTTTLADTIERVAQFFLDKKDPKVKAERHAKKKAEDLNIDVSVPPPVAAEPPSSHDVQSRYIPAAIRHEVTLRDAASCSFINPLTGKRCGETRHLEFDHLKPFALAGEHSVENIRILCRGHNQLYAEEVYGKDFIARRVGTRQGTERGQASGMFSGN